MQSKETLLIKRAEGERERGGRGSGGGGEMILCLVDVFWSRVKSFSIKVVDVFRP